MAPELQEHSCEELLKLWAMSPIYKYNPYWLIEPYKISLTTLTSIPATHKQDLQEIVVDSAEKLNRLIDQGLILEFRVLGFRVQGSGF